MVESRWVVQIGTKYFHTGNGDFVFGGQTYKGDRLLSVGPHEEETDARIDRQVLQFQEVEGDTLLNDLANADVILDWLVRASSQADWTRVARRVRGKASAPSRQADNIQLQVETPNSNLSAGQIEIWSAEAQAARANGDKGMMRLAESAAKISNRWPPLG